MSYFFGFLVFFIAAVIIFGVMLNMFKKRKKRLEKRNLQNESIYSKPSGRPDSPISRQQIKSSSPSNIPTSRQHRMDNRKVNERKREQKQENYMDHTNPTSPLYLFDEEINSNKNRFDDSYDSYSKSDSYSATRSYSDDSPSRSYGSSDYGGGSSGSYDSGGSSDGGGGGD